MQTNPNGFSDYGMLEFVLFQSVPRLDIKPLAKNLLSKFGIFNQLINLEKEKIFFPLRSNKIDLDEVVP